MYKLTEDVYSYGKARTLYGLKGDTVKIIADHDNVFIVEHVKSGKRFSVNKLLVIKVK